MASLNLDSPKNIINFNDTLNAIIHSTKTSNISKSFYNKFYKNNSSKKLNLIDKRKNIYYKNKLKFLSNYFKSQELIDRKNTNFNSFNSRDNYKQLKQKVENKNKIFISKSLICINKNNKNKIKNIFKYKTENDIVDRIKNNNNKISFSKNIIKLKNKINYNELYNTNKKKYSFSINQNSSFINKLLNEEEDYMNINTHKKTKKNNNKLLNKFYIYKEREKNNYSYQTITDHNINFNILKNMKESINKNYNSKIDKNIIINNQNTLYKSDFIDYIKKTNNYCIKANNNLKFNSYYFHNLITPQNKENKNKNNSNNYENSILKSYSYYIDSMREDRKTNNFIKELNKNKNNILLYTSRFSYDKENIDINNNKQFYMSLKSNRINENEKNNFYHISNNYEQKRNYIRKKKSSKINRNRWKTNSFKTINISNYYLNDNHNNYLVKSKIMPSNDIF